MAKSKSMFLVSGTLGGVTFAQQKGRTITRAPRGTYKQAVLNETCEAVKNRNPVINQAAQLVHTIIKRYAPTFKMRGLWQVMQSRLRKCKTDDLDGLLKTLEGMEVNPRYSLGAILLNKGIDVHYHGGLMTVTLRCSSLLHFPLPDSPTSYYLEFCILLIDEDRMPIDLYTINSGWKKVEGPDTVFETSFEIPVLTRHYVLMLKVQGGDNERQTEDHRSTGIQVLKTGVVDG